MRTPAGRDCKHYYEDFHRGRNIQECRLAKENLDSKRWHPTDCAKCRVPDILNANASPDLALTLTIRSRLLGFVRVLDVTATCLRHRIPVPDPYIGCPECAKARSNGLDVFRKALEGHDD
jgi:hypothetical protein